MVWLIIVTGRPAAGKSTMAAWLGQKLGIPVIGKDPLKEILFAELGWRDREWSKMMGRASVELLYYLARTMLASGVSLLIENAFHPELASPSLRIITQETKAVTLQIIWQADNEVLFQRFQQRNASGLRHVGHVDAQSLDELRVTLAQDRPLRLDLDGPVIEVDTTDFTTVRYEAIWEQVKAIMNEVERGSTGEDGT